MSKNFMRLHVVAGAVFDAAGRVLIAQRPAGKHMAGAWEFPGGKLLAHESPRTGLQRELREELGIEVLTAQPITTCTHDYPDRCVLLDFWHVVDYVHTPTSQEGQNLRWVALTDLSTAGLLAADQPLVAALLSSDKLIPNK